MQIWEDIVKGVFRELGCENLNWIHPAQDRVKWGALVNTVMNLRFP
jgi:hypothetical protein